MNTMHKATTASPPHPHPHPTHTHTHHHIHWGISWSTQFRAFRTSKNTVKPALKTTYINRPPVYKDPIVRVPRGMLFMLLNLHIRPLVYKDHILLVPRVVFICKFHGKIMLSLGNKAYINYEYLIDNWSEPGYIYIEREISHGSIPFSDVFCIVIRNRISRFWIIPDCGRPAATVSAETGSWRRGGNSAARGRLPVDPVFPAVPSLCTAWLHTEQVRAH